MDYTGCGNTLNMTHPRVLQMIMDSLRYWVLEMHVDGFRFDLASALARELHEVDKLGAFFDIIHQDPVLSQVKLIAEPWDLGQGGYQVGNFPIGWTEWNGKYRDSVRSFWKGRRGEHVGIRHPAVRIQRPLRTQRSPALREHQLCHRPRRVHVKRYGELQRPNTTRPTAKATATGKTTIEAGIAASRGRPTTRPCCPSGKNKSAISWPPCSSPKGCP
jgi:hypothetical protein